MTHIADSPNGPIKGAPRWVSSAQLSRAFSLAQVSHAHQGRKVGNTPYIGHLMGVAALVIDHGGTEEQACAALLHDALEDTDLTYDEVLKECGPVIANMVRDCSDTEENMPREEKIRTFVARKTTYLDHLRSMSGNPAALVALADKTNNAENTLRDVRAFRAVHDVEAEQKFWATFNSASVDQQKWWYTSLADVFESLELLEESQPLVHRFRETVSEIFSS